MNVYSLLLVVLSLTATGCSGGGEHKEGSKPHPQVSTTTPGEAVRSYIMAGGSHFRLDDKALKIEEQRQQEDKCKPADECGTVTVTAAGYIFPFAYTRVGSRWFIDGIPLTEDWKPEFEKPRLSTVEEQKRRAEKEEKKRAKPQPSQPQNRVPLIGNNGFINASPNPDDPNILVFCDVGLAYCQNTVKTLASIKGVNTSYWPVSMSDWSVEANTIVLSSPQKMRMKVFSLLSAATGIRKEDLRAHVKRQLNISIQDALFKMNKDAVAKLRDEAIKAGVKKIPTVILADSSTIVGNLPADSLAKRVAESIQGVKEQSGEIGSAEGGNSGNKPVEKEKE